MSLTIYDSIFPCLSIFPSRGADESRHMVTPLRYLIVPTQPNTNSRRISPTGTFARTKSIRNGTVPHLVSIDACLGVFTDASVHDMSIVRDWNRRSVEPTSSIASHLFCVLERLRFSHGGTRSRVIYRRSWWNVYPKIPAFPSTSTSTTPRKSRFNRCGLVHPSPIPT